MSGGAPQHVFRVRCLGLPIVHAITKKIRGLLEGLHGSVDLVSCRAVMARAAVNRPVEAGAEAVSVRVDAIDQILAAVDRSRGTVVLGWPSPCRHSRPRAPPRGRPRALFLSSDPAPSATTPDPKITSNDMQPNSPACDGMFKNAQVAGLFGKEEAWPRGRQTAGVREERPASAAPGRRVPNCTDARQAIAIRCSADDVYRCPAGEKLAHHFTADEDGQKMRIYLTKACRTCPFKDQCTTSKERRIKRWEHEHVVEAAQMRLDQNPQAMRVRRETVEHPFATLKMRMGATHFLMKRLPNVATEMALNVLAYNLTRVMNIVGIKPLLVAIRA